MDFAFDHASKARFVENLQRRGGALALSWLHFFELSQLSNQSQTDRIITFLESISPHLFFINPIPKEVIARENSILRTKKVIAPHADDRFLKSFLLHKRAGLDVLSFGKFLRDFQQKKVIKMRQDFMSDLNNVLDEYRRKAHDDLRLGSRIKRVPIGPHIPHATRYVDVDVMRYLVRDKIQMSSNDWIDYFHMVVPLSYCDLLLLDRRWATKAKEIVERLRKAGHLAMTARVFSKRNIKGFWSILEK